MIISPGRQYIFAHIPKTGGTALACALEARAMKEDILIGDTPKAQRRKGRLRQLHPAGRLWKHSTLADIDGIVTRDQMARWQVVTLVRNPWDRLVSYYHWLRGQGFDHPAVALAKQLTFEAFVSDPQTEAGLRANPYARYVTDAAGVCHADHFVRLEHWQEDLAPFCAHLGFDLELPVVNASPRARDWRGYYSDASAARVAALCAQDIARSGYQFDPQAGPQAR